MNILQRFVLFLSILTSTSACLAQIPDDYLSNESSLNSSQQLLVKDTKTACNSLPYFKNTNHTKTVDTADSTNKSIPTLRVVTYNIHHGEAMDGKFDYERLAKTIAQLKPDIVALQEVDYKTRRADGVDIAAKLGDLLKMNHVFGNALYYSGGQYGEAILSRFSLKDVKAHHLPFRFGNEPRTALEARVIPDNGLPEFVFVGTHLCHESGETRLEQTQELARLFNDRNPLPVILAGDLNARPTSKAMKVLIEEKWIDTVAPKSKIDYILLRKNDPWKIVETIVVDEPVVSDHDPILTVLEWMGDIRDNQ